MIPWPRVALRDVFEIVRGGSPRPIDAYVTDEPGGINWIMIGDATAGSKYITSTKKRIRQEGAARSRRVQPGDLLLTNSMSFGKPFIMGTSGCIHDGWLVLSRRKENVDADFFYHLLGSSAVYSEFERRAAGATVKNLNIDLVQGVEVLLPPLSEQRRIASVLDRAEALRAKRRAALAQLDALTQAVFLDLFGDPDGNPKGWPLRSLQSILSRPLRNGLSPSNTGGVIAKVLTLSAVTGSRFDATAWKTSTFKSPPPLDQSVNEADLLVCRGNGNPHLVGKGYFPTCSMPAVTFPDTMIAARISVERIVPAYLQHVWNSSAVRRQISSLARTTNATFKVNQTLLETVVFAAPPLDLQREFARRAASLDNVEMAQRASLAEMDALFAALQHRAFRGEL